jgi:hypothetical protein
MSAPWVASVAYGASLPLREMQWISAETSQETSSARNAPRLFRAARAG